MMFVQYSFVRPQPSSDAPKRDPFDLSPTVALFGGIAFMLVTSVLYVLLN